MYYYICECGNTTFYALKQGEQTGLYCDACDRLIEYIGEDEEKELAKKNPIIMRKES